MLAADFDFNLPRELIAQTPADPRDSAKLLQLNRVTGEVSHHVFHELDQLLGDDVVLVFNQTKVEPRRLLGHKDPTGGSVEVMALEPCRMEAASLTPGMQSLLQVYADTWECLVHPGLSPGQKVLFQQGNQFLQAMVFGATEEGTRWIGT